MKRGHRATRRIAVFALTSLFIPGPVRSSVVDPAGGCQARRISATGAAFARYFGCHAVAAADGVRPDATCLALAKASLVAALATGASFRQCATAGDDANVERDVEAEVSRIAAALQPNGTRSACVAAQFVAVGRYVSSTLDVAARARKRVAHGLRGADLAHVYGPGRHLWSDFSAATRSEDCGTSGSVADVIPVLEATIGDLVETLWPLAATGITVSHPRTWHLDAIQLLLDGPVRFDTFGGAWQHGGILPPDGAAISIGRLEQPPGSLGGALATILAGDQAESVLETTVQRRPAIRAVYRPSPLADPGLMSHVLFVDLGSSFGRIFFDYRPTDEHGPAHLHDLESMLAGIQFRESADP